MKKYLYFLQPILIMAITLLFTGYVAFILKYTSKTEWFFSVLLYYVPITRFFDESSEEKRKGWLYFVYIISFYFFIFSFLPAIGVKSGPWMMAFVPLLFVSLASLNHKFFKKPVLKDIYQIYILLKYTIKNLI